MWMGHRPLWRNSKTGFASSSDEAQSPCVREESPDFRHGEYVKNELAIRGFGTMEDLIKYKRKSSLINKGIEIFKKYS